MSLKILLLFGLVTCSFSRHLSTFNHNDAAFKGGLKTLQLAAKQANENAHSVLFSKFVALYNRTYIGKEKNKRFHVFKQSLVRHSTLNEKELSGNGTAEYGVNQFSDWTTQEFKQIMLSGHRGNSSYLATKGIRTSFDHGGCSVQRKNIPPSKDWRSMLTRIKDQKTCGSCWAFVASEQVEAYQSIAGHPTVELSPQQLLSCSRSLGCDGGNTCLALSWLVETNNVLETEKEYPYEEKKSKCYYNPKSPSQARVTDVCGCRSLVGNEDLMLLVLDQKGPMAVNVDAVSWHDYIGGIIQHHCTNDNMNHAVQLVGYHLHGNVPYWLLRNQWGESFGENGFLRVKYGENVCGVAEQPSFIVV